MIFLKKYFLAATVFLLSLILVSGMESDRKILNGHVPQIIPRLKSLGRLPGTNQLSLAIGLPLRNQTALDDFLSQLNDPASPNFRHFLTPAEFTARFGPTESDYAAVKNFAQTNGLTITATSGNRLLLDVSGPVSTIEKTFHLQLKTYRHPDGSRTFYAPDTEPYVDARLAIADISGLNDFSRPHPNFHRRPMTFAPHIGSGLGSYYFGDDFRAAYAPGSSLNGSGQMVGLLQFDGFYSNDIASYASAAGFTNIPVQTVLIDGFGGQPVTADGNVEASLDIEMAMAMAPALNAIVVFEGDIPNDILGQMAASNTVKNLSSSWGWSGGPSVTTDALFQEMAAQGQTYFNASGDSDAFPPGYVDNPDDDAAPSSNPYIVQVGATDLATAAAGGNYSSESVWNWGYDASAGGYVGSSGGVSSYYSIPFWQLGINSFSSNGGSTLERNIPDVAMVGDDVLVYYGNGQTEGVGGTSCAAPLWAGFLALANQQAATSGQTNGLGLINPLIYELANQSLYNSVFNDVTVGNNISSSSPNAFYAGPNYDLCTGLGSPNGTNFINALLNPDPLIVTTNYGFTAVSPGNGFFNPSAQTFFLTNASAFPLSWSLVNTSAWLDVSSSGDTLSSGAGESVSVSLDPSTSTLSPGIYPVTLSFSNVTSGVSHSRLITLQVNDPLVILTAKNLSFIGQSGGPFAPATQPITLTNFSANSINWTLGNTSVWFNLSATNGTLAGGSQISIAVNLTTAATNLANGIYPATFTLTDLNSQIVQSITNTIFIGQSLVQNGGFETGDFTGWTLSGATGSYNFVDNGTNTGVSPHSGNYLAALGQSGSLAYLSQTAATIPGQTYLLSFWLDNPLAGSSGRHGNPNQFNVSWNGTTLFNQVNLPQFGWTDFQYIVTATNTSSVLQFGARDDNDYLCLDDVTVLAGFAPAILLQPTNAIALTGNTVVFTATVSGTPAPVLQWNQNSASISGATNSLLTLSNVTASANGNYTLVATNIFGSVSNTVTLAVYPPPLISVSATNYSNSRFTLNFSGAPGYTYFLQTTTNLVTQNWLTIATNTFGTNGLWQFTDTQAANFPQQFYRLQLAP